MNAAKILTDKISMLELYHKPLDELSDIATKINSAISKGNLELCSIINAKSGQCGEDCKYCAQSVHYNGKSEVYKLLDKDLILKGAVTAKKNGALRYGIVTSGVAPSNSDFEAIIEAIKYIHKRVDIAIDASLGILKRHQLASLKDAGLIRYHHNLETSREYFPKVTTTHTFDERIEVAKNVVDIGLELCCGGILGIGETAEDRISLAIDIANIAPTAIPINFLVPIKGTPLENMAILNTEEALKTIAIFRIICHNSKIILAGGRREVLKDKQLEAFYSGANGMIIGDLLTTENEEIKKDIKFIERVKNCAN